MPVPLGKKDRPTKLSMTELFPELCNRHGSCTNANVPVPFPLNNNNNNDKIIIIMDCQKQPYRALHTYYGNC
jgi:hypothetical protein